MADAEVLAEDLLGAEGEGWKIAATTLSAERQGFGGDRSGAKSKICRGRFTLSIGMSSRSR